VGIGIDDLAAQRGATLQSPMIAQEGSWRPQPARNAVPPSRKGFDGRTSKSIRALAHATFDPSWRIMTGRHQVLGVHTKRQPAFQPRCDATLSFVDRKAFWAASTSTHLAWCRMPKANCLRRRPGGWR